MPPAWQYNGRSAWVCWRAADVGQTISVAGSDLTTKFNTTHYGDPEGFYSYSNTGSCVDVFAPGVDIFAACGGSSPLPLLIRVSLCTYPVRRVL